MTALGWAGLGLTSLAGVVVALWALWRKSKLETEVAELAGSLAAVRAQLATREQEVIAWQHHHSQVTSVLNHERRLRNDDEQRHTATEQAYERRWRDCQGDVEAMAADPSAVDRLRERFGVRTKVSASEATDPADGSGNGKKVPH